MNQYTWKTKELIRETEDALTIIFDTGNDHFSYLPGQFVNLSLTIKGQYYSRSYSLSSTYEINPYPSITIKRVSGGIVSNYILDNISKIKAWAIEGPCGNFTLPADHLPIDTIVLMAGGSGITPVVSIARFILQYLPCAKIKLFYSARQQQAVIFRKAIEQWIEQYPDRFNASISLSQPPVADKALSSHYLPIRLNKLITKKLLKETLSESASHTLFFLCGPDGLMQQHLQVLEGLKVPEDGIFKEWFQPPQETEVVDLPDQVVEVQLHYYGQTNLLEVAPGKTILEVALEDRVPLRYSCKSGTCGLCRAILLSGRVTMAANYALTQQEVDAGKVLLCQAHPLDNEVTVEIM